MAKTKKAAPAKDGEEVVEPAEGGRKKIVLIALPLLALIAGWYFLLGPGGGGASSAAAEEKPKPGAVLELEPITMNLADGRLLKVGLALQQVYEPKEYELTGSKALDEAISYLGAHTYDQLAVPAGREAAKDELSRRVAERYHGDVIEVYFTEFVMQ
jgi:flagellar FliL protein